MTYDDVTKALAAAGFFTYYRRESDTLICSAAEWPNVPQMANSFWLAERRTGWYIATWTPRLYCSTPEWPNVPRLSESVKRVPHWPARCGLWGWEGAGRLAACAGGREVRRAPGSQWRGGGGRRNLAPTTKSYRDLANPRRLARRIQTKIPSGATRLSNPARFVAKTYGNR